jgi:hypothetical protein
VKAKEKTKMEILLPLLILTGAVLSGLLTASTADYYIELDSTFSEGLSQLGHSAMLAALLAGGYGGIFAYVAVLNAATGLWLHAVVMSIVCCLLIPILFFAVCTLHWAVKKSDSRG